MATLSVSMIAKDEEDVIGRALSCAARFADEIVVADTGSGDKTVKIARSLGAKVFSFPWRDDFSDARNFSFSNTTCDYVMWLDCDDVIDGDNVQKLIALKPRLDEADIWYMKYATAFSDDGRPTFEYWRERVFRRSLGACWTDPVHEVFYAAGSRRFSDVTVRHKKTKPSPARRNLDIYLSLLSSGKDLSPRQKFYFANELYSNNLPSLAKAAYADFLDSDGMKENKIQAAINLSRIYSAENDFDAALCALLRALSYGEPTAETCVALGNIYLALTNTDAAIFWYNAAMRPVPENTLAFVDVYCYNYYPLVQTGLCHYKKGDLKQAISFTKRALSFKPHDPVAEANLAWYEKKLAESRGGNAPEQKT